MELGNWDDDDDDHKLAAPEVHHDDDFIQFSNDDPVMAALGSTSLLTNDADSNGARQRLPVPPGWQDLIGDGGVLLKLQHQAGVDGDATGDGDDDGHANGNNSNTSNECNNTGNDCTTTSHVSNDNVNDNDIAIANVNDNDNDNTQTPMKPSELQPFVELHYDGYVHESGDKFDSSRDQNYPMIVQLDIPPTGKSVLIPGLEIALRHMHSGQTTEVIIRSQYAYGDKGTDDIAPNSDLRFHVQILDVRATHRPVVVVDDSEKDLSRLEAVRKQREIAQLRREEEQASRQAEKDRKAQRVAALREKLANKNAPGKKKGGKKKK